MPELRWMRFGSWSAHLYVDGKQACKIKHGNFSLSPRPIEPREPTEVTELTQHGVPFGKSCALCMRTWERHKRPKKEKPASALKPPPSASPVASPKTRGSRRAERMLQIAREIELLEQRLAQKEREFERLLSSKDD